MALTGACVRRPIGSRNPTDRCQNESPESFQPDDPAVLRSPTARGLCNGLGADNEPYVQVFCACEDNEWSHVPGDRGSIVMGWEVLAC
jgi:hypothetical protein